MFAPNYKELTVFTKFIKVTTDNEVRYIPDLPINKSGLILVNCDGRNHYAYPLPASCEGKDAICHVVYFAEDDLKMQSFAGKLGTGYDVCKLQQYKDCCKTTIADVKIAEEKQRLILEAEKNKVSPPSKEELDAVTYEEADKDDGYPQWVFLKKDYADNPTIELKEIKNGK